MKGILRSCDVGVLLTQEDMEFNAYNHVYDGKYGYYNENIIACKYSDTDSAIAYANEYVENGSEMTYAVIADQGICDIDEPFDDSNVSGFTFNRGDVIYFVAKIKGETIKNFIKNTQ